MPPLLLPALAPVASSGPRRPRLLPALAPVALLWSMPPLLLPVWASLPSDRHKLGESGCIQHSGADI
ncbi:unnamed protein product [Ranitomeya imitator]|uniref:Uncharacterized protein n=1 Tax=Ranitomeya imitator TaxID=111125 RepID=A0ABN9KST8_9NEOB|nr:unnamed protein product [Ranitomeya imitator]